MDTGDIINITRRALYIATAISMPVLIVCLVVGVFISIFQAATQIHEQSLTFVPKIIAVLLVILIAGGWMVTQMSDFTKEAFNYIANLS